MQETETTGRSASPDQGRPEPDWDNVLQFPGSRTVETGEAAADPLAGPGDAAGRAPVIMSKDEFWQAFRALFEAPNGLLMMRGKQPLESLPIAADDEQGRAASDAIYDTCLEVAWLRWILAPENVYVQRAFVIGMFFAGKAGMVRAELMERARAAQEAPEAPRPAPEPPKAVNQPAERPGPAPDDGAVIGKMAA